MSKRSTEQAAGGLVWRRVDDAVEILLVHRPRYDDWAFAKGKLDAGESLIECALREVREETGLRCTAGRYLGISSFTKPSGRPKEVSYWAMEVVDGAFCANEEVDKVAWVPAAELHQRLTYEVDRGFFASLDPSWTDPANRILLIRHAHAGDRFAWTGDEDARRPLSERGHAQARNIKQLLEVFPMDRLLTSPATRCLETIASIAEERSLPLQETDALWEEATFDEVGSLVDRSKTGSTVFCTHGPVLAMIMHSLGVSAVGLPMEKASTWILDFWGESLHTANYLAPFNPQPE